MDIARTTRPDPTVSLPAAATLHSHPAAGLFPLLDVGSPEFGELVADIREHGLLEPTDRSWATVTSGEAVSADGMVLHFPERSRREGA